MKETLKKIITDQDPKLNRFYSDYQKYKTVTAEIFNRQMPLTSKINNKVNHSYMSTLVDTKVNHFLGNPVSIQLSKDDTALKELLIRFKRQTAFDRVLSEIGINAALYGYSPVLAFINKNGDFDFVEQDAYACYFGEGISARIIGDTDNDRYEDEDEYHVLEVYDDNNRYFFKYSKGGELEELTEWNGIESGTPHLFNSNPLFKIKNNKDELPEHYRVRHIITTLDKLYSDLSSEVEAFRLSYLAFTGCDIDAEEIRAMVSTGALSLPEGAKVEFLTKQLQIKAVLDLIAKEEENLYAFAGSYDSNKSERMGNMTNLGIHFVVTPINNNCRKTIHYFREGLYDLFNLYAQYLAFKNIHLDIYDLDFEFTLANPKSMVEEAQIQATLKGLVSTATRLKLASFVDNVDGEIARMREEEIEIEE